MAASSGIHAKAENVFGPTATTAAQTSQVSGSTFVAYGFGNNAVTISDSKGNTWTSAGTQNFNGTNGKSVCAYVQNAVGGSSHTFTVTQSGGGGPQIEIEEVLGCKTTGGYEAFASANPSTSGSAAVAGPSITTTVNGCLVGTGMGGASNVNSVATAANGTILDSISGANFITGASSYQVQSTAGAVNETFTFSGQTFYDMATFNIAFAPLNPTALAGAASVASAAVGQLSTGIRLAGTPTSASSATGFLMGLMANAAAASVGVGALTTGIPLTAAAIAASVASGTFGSAIQIAGSALSSSSASATLTNWSTVVLAGTLYTGAGGILDPHIRWDIQPTVGSTIAYDGTFITIHADGTISSTSSDCMAVVQFFDGSTWEPRILFLTSGLQAYADFQTSATGALSTAIQLAGAATLLVQATGTLNAQINLQGAVQAVTAAVGALTTQIILVAQAITASAATGTLSGTQGGMSGNAVSTSVATGSLNAQIQLAGSAIALSAAVGALATQIRLAASLLSVTAASGTLITATQLTGATNVASAATGALLTGIRIAGAAISVVGALGDLSTNIALLGAAISSSIASGDLTTHTGLAGAAQSVSSAQAELTTLISLRASAFSISNADAQLLTQIPLSGGALGTDSATGSLTATGSGSGLYPVDPYFVIGIRRQYFTQRFPVIGPGEAHVLTFNFADELVAGEKLQGIIDVRVSVSAGVDGNAPGDLIAAAPAYDPTLTEVTQPIHGAIQDNDYYFTVTAPTSNPFKTLTRYGLLSVRG